MDFIALLGYGLVNNVINIVAKPISNRLESIFGGEEKRNEAIAIKDYQHELDLKMLCHTRILDHQNKLQLQQESFNQRLLEAEYQYEQYRKKSFDQRIWPLNTPYENFSLNPLTVGSGLPIIPCRIFTAKSNRNTDYARDLEHTVNTRLSMFLEKGYDHTGKHPVISHLGDWRNDTLQEDAFINSLWYGLQGQPVVVLNPVITDNGNTLNLRISFWGLGGYTGQLCPPATNTVMKMNLARIRGNLIREESRRLMLLGMSNISNELKFNFELLAEESSALNSNREYLIEINTMRYRSSCEVAVAINKEMSENISAAMSCFAGLYTDIYHLIEYGAAPIMPIRMNQDSLKFPLSIDFASFYRGSLARLAMSGYHSRNMKFIYLDTARSLLHIPGYQAIVENMIKEGICLMIAEKDSSLLPVKIDEDWDKYIDKICSLLSKCDSRDDLFVKKLSDILRKSNLEDLASQLQKIEIIKDIFPVLAENQSNFIHKKETDARKYLIEDKSINPWKL